MPYLIDEQARLGVFLNVEPLTHGGKKKTARIVWALHGRFQNDMITLQKGPWVQKFTEQYLDFPNPTAHDDMLDSLAYVDQLAQTIYSTDFEIDDFEILDSVTGI